MIDSPYLVTPGKNLKLSKRDTSDKGDFKDRKHAEEASEDNLKKLTELQDRLYADGNHALLVVIQGMDTAGKDGGISHVFSGVNPQGCSVHSFKAPSTLERAHDYLWRAHAAVPPKGMIGIFNRSHYEDVLIVRVHNLFPEKVWSKRYDQINDFEHMLADEGVAIVKFFLHISKDEQKERLQARLDDKSKNWKFNIGDLAERKLWDDYQQAYEALLEKCSTKWAPWYIVPSDRKWFRNWVLSDTLVRTLKSLDLKYPKPEEGLDKVRID